MRTQLMIVLIVGTVGLCCLLVVAGLIWWLGWAAGLLSGVTLGASAVAAYLLILKPRNLRWGATDDEVRRRMPGDDLISDASSATRAVTINANPDQIWPWLVQLGYDKAGWYSYDWIDNHFRPSADHVIDEYQHVVPGDRILMMPDMGFVVKSAMEPRSIVSVLEDGSTSWCLALYPEDTYTRPVSRWRPKLQKTAANLFMTVLAEPGTFIMEQKMLRTIRDRAEQKHDDRSGAGEGNRTPVFSLGS